MQSDPEPLAAVLKVRAESNPQETAKSQKPSTLTPTTSLSRSDFPAIVRPAPGHLRVASWEGINPRVAELLRHAIRVGKWPIVLRGPVGTGKSCSAACVYQSWPRPRAAHWYRLEAFVREITTCRTSRDKKVACKLSNGETVDRTESGIWGLVDEPNSLWCLDDLGTRAGSESGYDIVFELFERRTGLPLIISTNLTTAEIAKMYDERIADRVDAGVSLNMTGRSRRKGAAVSINIDRKPKG